MLDSKVVIRYIKIHYEKSLNMNFLVLIRSSVLHGTVDECNKCIRRLAIHKY